MSKRFDGKADPRWLCTQCKHFNPIKQVGDTPTCKAFPAGIPATIIMGVETHRRNIPGDGGIKFEPKG